MIENSFLFKGQPFWVLWNLHVCSDSSKTFITFFSFRKGLAIQIWGNWGKNPYDIVLWINCVQSLDSTSDPLMHTLGSKKIVADLSYSELSSHKHATYSPSRKSSIAVIFIIIVKLSRLVHVKQSYPRLMAMYLRRHSSENFWQFSFLCFRQCNGCFVDTINPELK